MKERKFKAKGFAATLIDLLHLMPKERGSISYVSEVNSDTNSRFYTVQVSPSGFMANFSPKNPELKIDKREFWDNNCQEYIVELWLTPSIKVWTVLNKTLPRDAKWLDSRR